MPVGEFRPGDHLVLVQRFFDDEVSEKEHQRVTNWIEAGHPEVVAYLEALEEMRLATNASIENAQEQVDFHHLWSGVEAGIDDIDAERGGSRGDNVVSIDAARSASESIETSQATPQGGGTTRWFNEYRQAIYGAAAAVLLVAAALGLFRDQIFGSQEKVVVEKTVVIVDSVEYSPGSDVLVDSPMEPASLQKKGDQEESPTVIWLFDSNENGESGVDSESTESQPAGDEEESPDAGDVDAGEEPLGQPM